MTKPGQFKDTNSDFELFKKYNSEAIQEALNSNLPLIIGSRGIATGRSALPERFAEWLNNELNNKLNISGTVKKNTTKGYEGYGIFDLKTTKKESSDAKVKSKESIEIYNSLGNKTESGNVKIVNNIFKNKNDKSIITAYRVNKKLGLLESFRKFNAIGNPIDWQDFKPRFKGDNATIAFIDWYLGNDFTNLEQNYRNELLSQQFALMDLPIEYYDEIHMPSHATALDYLINKYEVKVEPKEPTNIPKGKPDVTTPDLAAAQKRNKYSKV